LTSHQCAPKLLDEETESLESKLRSLGIKEDEEYFIIDLWKDVKGTFGKFAIEVDAGTFDLMKLKIKRTELGNDDFLIKSVEYDGKEVEVNTDANGGGYKGDYHNFISNVEGYSSHDRTS